jgi:two-component sensor histidine kinase
MDLTRSAASALSITFAELIENSVKHGEIRTPEVDPNRWTVIVVG